MKRKLVPIILALSCAFAINSYADEIGFVDENEEIYELQEEFDNIEENEYVVTENSDIPENAYNENEDDLSGLIEDGDLVDTYTQDELKANGIIKVRIQFENVAAYLNSEYDITSKDTGNVINTFSVEKEYYDFSLEPGSYYLKELRAPVGHTVADKVEFKVTADGLVYMNGRTVEDNVIIVKDIASPVENTSVRFQFEQPSGLLNTSFNVISKDTGSIIATFSLDNQYYDLVLEPGSYRLDDASAPVGYTQSQGIDFEVSTDGKVYVGGNAVQDNIVKIKNTTPSAAMIEQPIRITGLQPGCECVAVHALDGKTVSVVSEGTEAILNVGQIAQSSNSTWKIDVNFGVLHESFNVMDRGLETSNLGGDKFFDVESKLFSNGNLVRTTFWKSGYNYTVSGKTGTIKSGVIGDDDLIEFVWYPEMGDISISVKGNIDEGQSLYQINDILNAIKTGKNARPSSSSSVYNPNGPITIDLSDILSDPVDAEYVVKDKDNNNVKEGVLENNSKLINLDWKEEMGDLSIKIVKKKTIIKAKAKHSDICNALENDTYVKPTDFSAVSRYAAMSIPILIEDDLGSQSIEVIDNGTGNPESNYKITKTENGTLINGVHISEDPDYKNGYDIIIKTADKSKTITVPMADLLKSVYGGEDYHKIKCGLFDDTNDVNDSMGSETGTEEYKETGSNTGTNTGNVGSGVAQNISQTEDTAKPAVAPTKAVSNGIKKMAAPKVKSKEKSKVSVSWKKSKKVKGYQIQYSLKKNFKKSKTKKVSSKKTSAVISKLKSGKTYYVRIRAYKKNGKNIEYGSWSKVKKIKVK